MDLRFTYSIKILIYQITHQHCRLISKFIDLLLNSYNLISAINDYNPFMDILIRIFLEYKLCLKKLGSD